MKIIYWLLTRYGWGFGLVSAPLGLVRDLGTLALSAAILMGVRLSLPWNITICVLAFGTLVGLGQLLYTKKYLHYAAKLTNQANPWDDKLDEILKILKEKK